MHIFYLLNIYVAETIKIRNQKQLYIRTAHCPTASSVALQAKLYKLWRQRYELLHWFAEERLNGLTGLYDVWSGKSHGNTK